MLVLCVSVHVYVCVSYAIINKILNDVNYILYWCYYFIVVYVMCMYARWPLYSYGNM
jgi:hypothetical protein